jgi:hypothetical protein
MVQIFCEDKGMRKNLAMIFIVKNHIAEIQQPDADRRLLN